MKVTEIDGSFGEGGGQILRTALSLSCITGSALRLFNIRKGRKRPGLRQQHLTSVMAASEMSGAELSGNKLGSNELTFIPGNIRTGSYSFDIGTAGSCSLVFQTLLPPLLFADKPSKITIHGGTHVPFSPPYQYLSEIFIPLLARIGIRVETSIRKYGYYPKGAGEVRFRIYPAKKIGALDLTSRGSLSSIEGCSGVSNLPANIAERQKRSVMKAIAPMKAHIETVDLPSDNEGAFVFLKAEYENIQAGFSSLGKRGKPAERVGKEAANRFLEFHNSLASIDPNLADQIVIYLALARGVSSFTTSRITQHLLTNLWVIEKFLKIHYDIEGELNSEGRVNLIPVRG